MTSAVTTSGRPSRSKRLFWLIGTAALVVSLIALADEVKFDALRTVWREVTGDPVAVLAVLAIYGAAFGVRAWVWTRILPSLRAGHALAALHISLAGNHLLPLRLGEALRVTSVVRRARIELAAATASTVMLRAADVLAVVSLAALFGSSLVERLVGPFAWLIPAGAVGVWIVGVRWLKRLQAERGLQIRISTMLIASTAVIAWVLESVVIWQAARWAGFDISVADAIVVTAVTIAAQTLAIAPGGIGTYEAAATASLVAVGASAEVALAAAIAAHALKTAYSLMGGGIALFVPSPSAFGRLRLQRDQDRVPVLGRPDRRRPVMIFMPAHNEEEAIAHVVERVPSEVHGHPVTTLVIDDGSSDRTVERARLAGAEVISFPSNRGLGAAVREGLRLAAERDVAAVAFCDADGEYAPEELGAMVGPILGGRADYVVGTRLQGNIQRMLPHRRLGNVALTKMLRFIARHPITDGQSGYRAFSREAAAHAEVIHDFNYAQVLTLDLLAKGYRYAEVPITYSFRTTGRSFVRLGRYLRHVLPAIHRQLNPGP